MAAHITRRIATRLERAVTMDRSDTAALAHPTLGEEPKPLTLMFQEALSERAATVRELTEVLAGRGRVLQQLLLLTANQGDVARELHGTVGMLTGVVDTLQRVVDQRGDDVGRLRDAVKGRDHDIAALHDLVQERDRLVGEHDRDAAVLRELVEERDRDVARLRGVVEQRDRLLGEVAQEGGTVAQLTAALKLAHEEAATGTANGVVQLQGDTSVILERISALTERLATMAGVRSAGELLRRHYTDDDDPNFQTLLALYDQALQDGLPYWDIRTAARVASEVIQPSDYLEVGTRRGWSLAQVFAASPKTRAFVFDLWAAGYGETSQGSQEYVSAKMQEIVGRERTPSIEFVTGNSHDTLPSFFAGEIDLATGPPPQQFDLITIDGDHTRLGAWWDLFDLFPRVKLGGAILFDDLDYEGDEGIGGFAESRFPRPPMPEHLNSLLDIWLWMQSLYPNFLFFTGTRLRYQTGIALRIR